MIDYILLKQSLSVQFFKMVMVMCSFFKKDKSFQDLEKKYEILKINDIDLANFDAIAYIGNKFSYVYATNNGNLLYKNPIAGNNHVEQIFNEIKHVCEIKHCEIKLKILICIEEDWVRIDMRKQNFKANHPNPSGIKNNDCKIISSIQYHYRFGFGYKKRGNSNLEDRNRRKIYELYNGRCAYCNEKISNNNFQIDHIVPITEGGNNYWKNLALACEKCNETKSNVVFYKSTNKACFRVKKYLKNEQKLYHFYKIKINGNYKLVRKQGNFGFKEYYTIYKKINGIYVNRDKENSGYQFIINIANKVDLEQITENGKIIENDMIEDKLRTQSSNKCSTCIIDDWLA